MGKRKQREKTSLSSHLKQQKPVGRGGLVDIKEREGGKEGGPPDETRSAFHNLLL